MVDTQHATYSKPIHNKMSPYRLCNNIKNNFKNNFKNIKIKLIIQRTINMQKQRLLSSPTIWPW